MRSRITTLAVANRCAHRSRRRKRGAADPSGLIRRAVGYHWRRFRRGALSMRSRRAVIAGGLGLALAALGYRAWDRGVLTGATGPAYTPWDEWGGSEPEGSQRPLRAGILAASPHNTQPWLFGVSGHTIEVHADRARHLGTFDPFRREMHLGLGCAIENFVCAARVFGIATE